MCSVGRYALTVTASLLVSLSIGANCLSAEPFPERHTLFVLEKSHNYQNVLVVYALLNEACQFQATVNGGRPVDFYWLMDANDPGSPVWEKQPHPLIIRETNNRLGFDSWQSNPEWRAPAVHNVGLRGTHNLPQNSFQVTLADLERYVDHDLGHVSVEVMAENHSGTCGVSSYIDLGRSGGNRRLELRTVYGQAKTPLGIPLRAVEYIELSGVDAATGNLLTVRFHER